MRVSVFENCSLLVVRDGSLARSLKMLEQKFLQKLLSRINAPLSRQPLVKGERLVRGEVSAAMCFFVLEFFCVLVVSDRSLARLLKKFGPKPE